MSIFCDRPEEEIQKFGWHACEQIEEYCDQNYISVLSSDIGTVVGGYQKWLKENGFKIVKVE